jgi:hypothetical protein
LERECDVLGVVGLGPPQPLGEVPGPTPEHGVAEEADRHGPDSIASLAKWRTTPQSTTNLVIWLFTLPHTGRAVGLASGCCQRLHKLRAYVWALGAPEVIGWGRIRLRPGGIPGVLAQEQSILAGASSGHSTQVVSQGRHHHSRWRKWAQPWLSGLNAPARLPQNRHGEPRPARFSIHPVMLAVAACMPSSLGLWFIPLPFDDHACFNEHPNRDRPRCPHAVENRAGAVCCRHGQHPLSLQVCCKPGLPTSCKGAGWRSPPSSWPR